MNYEVITELLQRFWEGETTLEEERLLKNYFTTAEVDSRLLQYRPYFLALQIERAIDFPASHRPLQRNGTESAIFRYAAAAAVLGILAIGAWWWSQPASPPPAMVQNAKLYEDTYDDPAAAALEIKAALALVSSKMRKGKQEATKGLIKMQTVDRYLVVPN